MQPKPPATMWPGAFWSVIPTCCNLKMLRRLRRPVTGSFVIPSENARGRALRKQPARSADGPLATFALFAPAPQPPPPSRSPSQLCPPPSALSRTSAGGGELFSQAFRARRVWRSRPASLDQPRKELPTPEAATTSAIPHLPRVTLAVSARFSLRSASIRSPVALVCRIGHCAANRARGAATGTHRRHFKEHAQPPCSTSGTSPTTSARTGP
jgi:hypothetical protein